MNVAIVKLEKFIVLNEVKKKDYVEKSNTLGARNIDHVT